MVELIVEVQSESGRFYPPLRASNSSATAGLWKRGSERMVSQTGATIAKGAGKLFSLT